MRNDNGNWTEKLSDDVYVRLCECTTTKDDIHTLVECLWDVYRDSNAVSLTKRDAVNDIADLLVCNNLGALVTEMRHGEYAEFMGD